MKLCPQTVTNALIDGVRKAQPKGGNERDVTTVITRPMWRIWNVAMNQHPDTPPTEWSPNPQCNRIFGSETIVIESEKFEAYSFSRNRENTVDSPPSL